MVTRAYVNGKIFTGRGEDDFVSAMTVEDGLVSWVGATLGVRAADEVVDLGGRTVLPGFLDTHTHPLYVARTVGTVPCLPPFVNDIDEMVGRLRESDRYERGEDVWIEGWGYDESKLAERRSPTAEDLDRVSRTQPVYVMRSDCHSGVANSRALRLAGVTRETPDPPGARFGRHPDGEPNGVLVEHGANDVVLRARRGEGLSAGADLLASAAGHYHRRGIVAVTEMMALAGPYRYLDLYRTAARRGLRQRAVIYYTWTDLQRNPIGDLTASDREGRIRVGGLKLFMDGSISARTAWVSEPYRGSAGGRGFATASDEQVAAAYRYARRNQIQLVFHAMGDRAIERVIDLFADLDPWVENGPSVRIDHATLVSEEHLARMRSARMRFGIVTQIIFFFAEYESYRGNLSDEQFRRAYPVRSLYHRCPDVALSSDAPATPWADPDNVFVSIQAAVTRRAHNGRPIVPEQSITVPQAVLLYTDRARALAGLAGLGRIERGFDASFIVLDRDIFTIPTDDIHRINIEQTFIGGECLYRRDADPDR